MSGAIFLIQDDGQLVDMKEQAYDSEDLLQELLANYPDLLAGDQIDSAQPRKWLLISREVGLPSEQNGYGRWSVDHLFLDQDAIPTLVEVKRSSDTRIRREVVGQMLDYAANAVVYWPVEEIRAKFEGRCEAEQLDPDQVLIDKLGIEWEPDEFWQKAKTNLQAGRVRLVFVADLIPTELKRIVEFLNEQMDPAEVLAVEIKQFIGRGLKTLVPRVIGQTAEATQKKSGVTQRGRQWDADSFFEALGNRLSAGEAAAAKRILEWAEQRTTRIYWGRGDVSSGFVPIFQHNGREHQLFQVQISGKVEIYFYWYQYKPTFDTEVKRRELLKRLNAIPGVQKMPDEVISKRPGIPLSVLKNDAALRQFLEIFDWFLQTVKADSAQ